ncbi:MAG: hypothetical protein DHS20C15_13250 [Planctomycetota bacterium]|nr:MAG: hypothetical protein DHS20C15_13250 [Planctomycetota bacterium]
MQPHIRQPRTATTTVARGLLVLLALLVGSADLQAQMSLKQVRKQAKQQLDAATKELRKGVSAALKDVTQDLKAARKQAAAGEATVESMELLFDELVTFQQSVVNARLLVSNAEKIVFLLSDLDDDADFDGFYPLGFTDGDGGLIDDFRQSSRAIMAKPYARIRKQLEALSKVAEDDSDVLITFFITTPREFQHFVSNVQSGFLSPLFRPRIDLALGVSLEEGPTDASRLFARGESVNTASLQLAGQGLNISKLFPLTEMRAGVTLGGSGSNALARGNLRLRLVTSTTSSWDAGDELNIGIR